VSFRITPTSHSELLNGDEPVSTLTQDFHFRLDNLLRTLVHAKPHFIRCVRPNETESSSEFDRSLVIQQVRSLQVLETVNLMAGGFPHRMRFKNFNSIYWMLAPIKILSRNEELAFDDCKRILDYLKSSLEQQVEGDSPIVKDWALGKKHVFLTEGTRQHLERLRTEKRNASVTLIQSVWRGFSARKKWPAVRRGLQSHGGNLQINIRERASQVDQGHSRYRERLPPSLVLRVPASTSMMVDLRSKLAIALKSSTTGVI